MALIRALAEEIVPRSLLKNMIRYPIGAPEPRKHENTQIGIARHLREYTLTTQPRFFGKFSAQYGCLPCDEPKSLHPQPAFFDVGRKSLGGPIVIAEKRFCH